MRDRQREVEPDVAVDVREPARLADERVTMEQHERRLAEALEEWLQPAGIRAREVQVPVAEAAVDLNRQRLAGRLVGLERPEQRFAHVPWGDVEVEPATVGRNRFQCGEASLPRGSDLIGEGLWAQLLDDALDPHDRFRRTARELAELVPARARLPRRVAVVDEQPVGAVARRSEAAYSA